MSPLLVLGYPTEEKAKEAYQEVLSLGDDFIVNLQSVAVEMCIRDRCRHWRETPVVRS